MTASNCSPDDIAVLELVARGWTTRRVAEHRNRSQRQIYKQLRDIRGVLGARTNVHAVVIAIRQGLL